jgi:hypothetical protein
MERLLEAGALDASLSPLQMKKNRPGSLLRVITKPELQEQLADIIFSETSTLGLRIYPAERRVEERRIVEVETAYGKIRVKVSGHGSFAPEYDDCRADWNPFAQGARRRPGSVRGPVEELTTASGTTISGQHFKNEILLHNAHLLRQCRPAHRACLHHHRR